MKEDLPDLSADFTLRDPTCLGLVDYIVLPHYPELAEENDAVISEFGQMYTFTKLTDNDYQVNVIE